MIPKFAKPTNGGIFCQSHEQRLNCRTVYKAKVLLLLGFNDEFKKAKVTKKMKLFHYWQPKLPLHHGEDNT